MADTSYYIPRLRFHLDSREGGQEKEMLSEKELALHKILSKVSRRTIIGQCIGTAIDRRSNEAFRKLVSELKQQLGDVPGCLKDVISEQGIRLLKGL